MWRVTGLALAGVLLLGAACGGGERRMAAYDSGPGAGDGSPGVDAGPGVDGGPGLDGGGTGSDGGGTGTDGGGGVDAGPACEPTAGAAEVEGYCDDFELALIDDGTGGVTARLTGRVRPDGLADGGCATIDEIEVQQGGSTIGTLSGIGAFSVHDHNGVLARTEALPEMTARCADDAERFGGFGFIVRGRMDGGTFETRCADAEGGSRWPPALVVTCHENVDEPPFGGYAMVEHLSAGGSSFLFTTFDLTVPHGSGGALLTADDTVRVIAHADPWSSFLVPDPFDISGFDTSVSEGSAPLPGTYSQVYMTRDGDSLGMDLCPPPDTDPGDDWEAPPVMLVRITGTGERGAYSTEAYVDYCTRTGS